MLTVTDDLPRRPTRVLVAGGSGSGKTTLAARLGTLLDLPHTEIDGLFHGPGWTERPSFAADVAALVAQERWVTEWQYTPVRPLLLSRADALVWLDLPRLTVLRRVVRRTLRRRLRREALWSGNVEPPLRTFLTDRDHIVRWAFRTHPEHTSKVAQAALDHPWLVVVRLRSPAEVEQWLTGPARRCAR